jgi:hypothetical protein
MLGSWHGASRAPPNTLWGVAKKTVKVRITFAWSGTDTIDVDLEDYHGK